LEIQPKDIHERTPFFVGSRNMMFELEDYLEGRKISSDRLV
jgi:fructose-1,6-bisphosphatase